MSLASTLLRVVLMISLLFNGLNAAMAALPAGGQADAGNARAHDTATADCHGHPLIARSDTAVQAAASVDDGHCRIKECVRSCAQHPLLAVQPATLPGGPALSRAPQPMPGNGLPAPPLPQISRPPIG